MSNNIPTLNKELPDFTIRQDIPFTYQIPTNTFRDLDGDRLTYSINKITYTMWQKTSAGHYFGLDRSLKLDSSTGIFSGTFPAAAKMTVQYSAADGKGGVATDEFIFYIQPARSKPLFYLYGTEGNDRITGDAQSLGHEPYGGNDYVDAGPGDDFVYASPGNDTSIGGAGDDTFWLTGYLSDYRILFNSTSGAFEFTDNGGNGDGIEIASQFETYSFKDLDLSSNDLLYFSSSYTPLKSDFRDVTALQDNSGHFLFTGNATEAEIMQQFGWKQATGLKAFETVDNPAGVTLHKFYYPPTNSFYYATDDQAKAVKAAFTGWVYQGATDMKVYTEGQLKSGIASREAVPIYQMWVNGTGHVYTTDAKLVDTLMGQDINTDLLTANNIATTKGTYNGVVFWGDPVGTNASGSLAPVSTLITDYRDAVALQDKDGHYLFTANTTESQIMQQYGWSVATGLKPFESADNAIGVTLHKFYYPPTNSFYYATDDQAKAVKAAFTGWDYQGATDLKVYTNAQYGAGSTPQGSVPIYQMWINGKGHVYTSDTALVDRLMGQDINTNILSANNVVTAVGTYNGVVFWGDPIG